MKTITATRKELITVFSKWNKEYYDEGEAPKLEDYKSSYSLGVKQADDLIKALTTK
ncbi:hypothetical protein LCGC14_2211880 [marine sediment metagenome]|uniref:Uncharacterized protein n=1 Tax=marine sediment metagenome TaxID=412755 RepID=A0A0F9FR34_9ZZZZ